MVGEAEEGRLNRRERLKGVPFMILARVVGTVVPTRKEERIKGIKFLLLEKIDPSTLRGKGDYVVAMDSVGAGKGNRLLRF